MKKALALFSGGLDSVLAAKVVADQGVTVEAVHYLNAFLPEYHRDNCSGLPAGASKVCLKQKKAAAGIGIKLHVIDVAGAHLKMMLNPRYGYGANLNPCIDCRIFMLRQAKLFMREYGFSFLISGEVVGQRPLSQRRDKLRLIDRDAQMEGLLLRPLSAKLLPVTIPEQNGWVDRERLFAFSGRSRKPQIVLAGQVGVSEYGSPAGGCLLTEGEFSRKFRAMTGWADLGLNDVLLAATGRHFHYKNYFRLVVGRDDRENKILQELADEEDILLTVREFSGPLTVVRRNRTPGISVSGAETAAAVKTAAALTLYYSKGKDAGEVWVDYWSKQRNKSGAALTAAAEPRQVELMRL